MNNILAYIALFGYLGDNHFPISGKDDQIIYIATIGYIFVLLEGCPYETFFSIDIELEIAHDNLGCLNGIERTYFGLTVFTLSVFFLEISEIIYGKGNEVSQVIFHLCYIFFYLEEIFLRLVSIIFSDTNHRNLGEALQVLIGDRAQELFCKRLEALI